jgi:hypothetical protein
LLVVTGSSAIRAALGICSVVFPELCGGQYLGYTLMLRRR